jgi:hypothetical protein
MLRQRTTEVKKDIEEKALPRAVWQGFQIACFGRGGYSTRERNMEDSRPVVPYFAILPELIQEIWRQSAPETLAKFLIILELYLDYFWKGFSIGPLPIQRK